MWMFTRIQTLDIFGKFRWKTLGIATLLAAVFVPVSLLLYSPLTEAMAFYERVVMPFSIVLFVMGRMGNCTSSGTLVKMVVVPASNIEKFISVYVAGYATALIFILYSALIGSLVYWLADIVFSIDGGIGFQWLFFRDHAEQGEIAGMVVGSLLMTILIPLLILINATEKTIWGPKSILALAVVVLPAILGFILEDYMGGITARIFLAFAYLTIAAIALRWSYRLFKKIELDKPKTIQP